MDKDASVRSGFESEAAGKEIVEDNRSKPQAFISVEGYDTRLPEDNIKTQLINHFNSCGEVVNVIVREDPDSPNLDRCALVILLGEGAEEKALQLNGTDIGGWNALVTVEPEEQEEEDEETQRYRSSLAEQVLNDRKFWYGVTVSGYDTSLPAHEVKTSLIEHFSSCGMITHVYVSTLDKMTNIYFHEKEGETRALVLCGTEVGEGFKITVEPVATIFTNLPPPSGDICFGYCIPAHMIEFAGEIHDKVATFKKHRRSI